jgi:hypothetical protein
MTDLLKPRPSGATLNKSQYVRNTQLTNGKTMLSSERMLHKDYYYKVHCCVRKITPPYSDNKRCITSYIMGTGSSFPGVKRPGREVNHSPPTSAEVKKMWIYTSTPPYAFMA